MPSDPRPHTARKPDGSEDKELEQRFNVIFRALQGPTSAKPTDLPTALAFLAELHARLGGK